MAGLFKNLLSFGVVDKGVEMLDDAFHTEQEKAGFKATLLKLYEPYKLIQRWLALTVTVAFVGLHVFTSVADIIYISIQAASFDVDSATAGFEPAPLFEIISQRNIDTLGSGWEWIMIWYFTGGVIDGGFKAAGNLIKRKKAEK